MFFSYFFQQPATGHTFTICHFFLPSVPCFFTFLKGKRTGVPYILTWTQSPQENGGFLSMYLPKTAHIIGGAQFRVQHYLKLVTAEHSSKNRLFQERAPLRAGHGLHTTAAGPAYPHLGVGSHSFLGLHLHNGHL